MVVRRAALVLTLCAVVASVLRAGESVCLKSGFCMAVESHMIAEGMLVLQSGHGTLQFPIDQVESISGIAAPAEPKKATIAQISSNAVPDSEELLVRAAVQEGLEPDFVRSVAMVESGLHQNALSPKGAMGLMQLMPMTAGQLGVDATLADQNAFGGAAFLRQLLLKYHGDSALALAAYNAGRERWRNGKAFLRTWRRTVTFLKVLHEYEHQQRMQAAKRSNTLASISNPAAVPLR